MADAEPGSEEAAAKEEPRGDAPAAERNACTGPPLAAVPGCRQPPIAALMAPKPSRPPAAPARPRDRMALGAYIADPASLPASVLIYYNDDFVALRDRFPKATVHALLLPRSARHALRHPLDALDCADGAFLAAVRAEAARLKRLVAAELRRVLGAGSAAEPEPGAGLPPGRDWAAEVRCGVHAVPSMRHVHVHVLSRDMHSPALRHRKHYNSFATPFFVDVADLPLAGDDARRDAGRMGYLRQELRCWRCGRDFGSQFARFKAHLDDEFEAWRHE